MPNENTDVAGDRLLEASRTRVRQQLPGSFESADPAAGMHTYAYGQEFSDLACMVARQGGQVRIGFYNAEELPDPQGMLMAWSHRHRYVHIANVGQLDQPALTGLFHEVRVRHGDRSPIAPNPSRAGAPAGCRREQAEYPAAEVLVCLLTGIVVGALFAAALDNTTTGLVLGLVVATTLMWIRKAGHEGAA